MRYSFLVFFLEKKRKKQKSDHSGSLALDKDIFSPPCHCLFNKNEVMMMMMGIRGGGEEGGRMGERDSVFTVLKVLYK